MDTIIIFEAGLQDHREFWLKGLAAHFNLILLQPWEPTWEKPYIRSYVPCSFDNWDKELRRLTNFFKNQQVKGVVCLNEGTVNFGVDLQKALGVTLTHDLADPRVIRNKLLMRKHLSEQGLLTPQTYERGQNFNYPVIVKPSEFMSSMGVTLVRSSQELQASMDLARTVDIPEEKLRDHYGLSDEVVIEEFVEGEEFSIECWVQQGNVLSFQVTKKIKVEIPLFYETGHISNATISSELMKEIENYVKKVVSSFSLKNGLYHLEVMINKLEIYTVELAARPGGGMIPYLYMKTSGLDYPYILGNIMTGKSLVINFLDEKSSSAVFFPFGANVHSDEIEKKAKSMNCEIVCLDYDLTKKSQNLSVRFGQVIFTGAYSQLLSLLTNLNKKCSNVV